MPLPQGYQQRLIRLVDSIRAEIDGGITCMELAVRVGVPSFNVRISQWRNGLSRQVHDDNFVLLAQVDPRRRSAAELKAYVMGQSNVSVASNLWAILAGPSPIHRLVSQALAQHGYALDDEGIDYFIAYSGLTRESQINVLRCYLNKSSDNVPYTVIAATVNRLMALTGPHQITADQLESLDGGIFLSRELTVA